LSLIDRKFRLAADAGDLGLSCTSAGLSLAGAPLLRTTAGGFAPRPSEEISGLMKAAYGRNNDPADLGPGLEVVAKALNQGDLGRAMIAALRLKLPELTWEGAVRLAHAHDALTKYDPDEPRDWRGRWTTGGGTGSDAPSKQRRAPRDGESAGNGPGRLNDQIHALRTLYPKLQSEFDNLGPVEFSKKVAEFGTWLGQQAHDSKPIDLLNVKAKYIFLQDRLSFWIDYKYKSPEAEANLISAADVLYTGAINSGVVHVGEPGGWPRSMNAVVAAGLGYEGANPTMGRRLATGSASDDDAFISGSLGRFAGLGGIVDKTNTDIVWERGVDEQGIPWENYLETLLPPDSRMPPGTRTWDFFDRRSGYVISAKTLDTSTYAYSSKPQNIYYKMTSYVDKAAEYNTKIYRPKSIVDPDRIITKQIQIAVPMMTTPLQWDQITRGILYGKTRSVSVVVTRIR
jgi:hypothetical protein